MREIMFSSLKLCKNKKKSQGVKGIGSEVRSPERIFCYKRKARAVTGKQNLSIEGSAKCHQGSLFPPFHKKKKKSFCTWAHKPPKETSLQQFISNKSFVYLSFKWERDVEMFHCLRLVYRLGYAQYTKLTQKSNFGDWKKQILEILEISE